MQLNEEGGEGEGVRVEEGEELGSRDTAAITSDSSNISPQTPSQSEVTSADMSSGKVTSTDVTSSSPATESEGNVKQAEAGSEVVGQAQE